MPKVVREKAFVSLRIDLHCVMESFGKPTEFAFRLSLFVLPLLIHLTSSALFKLLLFRSPEMISRISSLGVTRDLHNHREAIKVLLTLYTSSAKVIEVQLLLETAEARMKY